MLNTGYRELEGLELCPERPLASYVEEGRTAARQVQTSLQARNHVSQGGSSSTAQRTMGAAPKLR